MLKLTWSLNFDKNHRFPFLKTNGTLFFSAISITVLRIEGWTAVCSFNLQHF